LFDFTNVAPNAKEKESPLSSKRPSFLFKHVLDQSHSTELASTSTQHWKLNATQLTQRIQNYRRQRDSLQQNKQNNQKEKRDKSPKKIK
jgi:hypothetical protein